MAPDSPTAPARARPARDPLVPRVPTARARMTNGTGGTILPGIDQRSATARRYREARLQPQRQIKVVQTGAPRRGSN